MRPYEEQEIEGLLRDALKSLLGHGPSAEVWRVLKSRRFVAEAVADVVVRGFSPEEAARDLEDWARELESLQSSAIGGGISDPSVAASRKGIALGRIIAIEAGRDSATADFRATYLDDGLLAAHDMSRWIHGRRDEDAAAFRARGELRRGMGFLRFVGGPEGGLLIHPGGILWELKRVGERLSGLYGLDQASALQLVLTGAAPATPQISAEPETAFMFPAATRITLRIDPRISARELERQYRKLRGLLPGTRDREMSQQKLELGVFVVEANDGSKRWIEVMEAWNGSKLGAAHSYKDVHRFIRDARRAFEGVTGTRLVWRKGAQRSPDGK